MNLFKRLADLNRRIDRSVLGLYFKGLIVGIVITAFFALAAQLFPSQRHNTRIIVPVFTGLVFGFWWGWKGGRAAWLFVFTFIFSPAVKDDSLPLIRNIEYYVIYLAIFFAGFGISYLTGCRKRTQAA
ncbi:MAG: hypothetical protein ABFD64_04695 [Armatimonadota bacterium]